MRFALRYFDGQGNLAATVLDLDYYLSYQRGFLLQRRVWHLGMILLCDAWVVMRESLKSLNRTLCDVFYVVVGFALDSNVTHLLRS